MLRVRLLPGFDAKGKAVLRRGKRTRGIRREGARRVVRPVEVDHHAVVAGGGFVHLQIAPAAVRLVPVRLVGEDEKVFRLVAVADDVEAVGDAVFLEDERAGRGLVEDAARHVGDGDGPRRVVRLEAPRHAPREVGRERLDAVEAGARGALTVLDADAEPVATPDDVPRERAVREDGRLRSGVGGEGEFRHGRAVVKHLHARRDADAHGGVGHEEDAEVRGGFLGEDDVVRGVASEGVFALVEPVEAHEREPAVGLREVVEAGLTEGGEVRAEGRLLAGVVAAAPTACRERDREEEEQPS